MGILDYRNVDITDQSVTKFFTDRRYRLVGAEERMNGRSSISKESFPDNRTLDEAAFISNIGCDTLIFCQPDMEQEEKLEERMCENLTDQVSCHSYILITRCRVLQARMIGPASILDYSCQGSQRGPRRENAFNIHYMLDMPGVTRAELTEFLRYLYCGRCHLTDSNVKGLLHLADMYMLPQLLEICRQHLLHMLTTSQHDLLWILQVASLYSFDDVTTKATLAFQRQARKHILLPGFTLISKELVSKIIQLPSNNVEEVKLLVAVLTWCLEEEGQLAGGSVSCDVIKSCLEQHMDLFSDIFYSDVKLEDLESSLSEADIELADEALEHLKMSVIDRMDNDEKQCKKTQIIDRLELPQGSVMMCNAMHNKVNSTGMESSGHMLLYAVEVLNKPGQCLDGVGVLLKQQQDVPIEEDDLEVEVYVEQRDFLQEPGSNNIVLPLKRPLHIKPGIFSIDVRLSIMYGRQAFLPICQYNLAPSVRLDDVSLNVTSRSHTRLSALYVGLATTQRMDNRDLVL